MRALIVAVSALSLLSAAAAAEPRVLATGDVVDISDYGVLSVPEARKVLREFGYRDFSFGQSFGDHIIMRCVSPERRLVRITINAKTGEIVRAYNVNNFHK